MHMKMSVRMFALQLLQLSAQLLKAFLVLGDGDRRRGRLPIASKKGHAMAISSGIDANADVGHVFDHDWGRHYAVSCHCVLLIATSDGLRSHETPPFIFGLGNPCDKRSCRMMYQFLTPKAGGTNLAQVVKPQVGVMIPRDSTSQQSAMIWRLAV
jgi:hypothetical protein